MQLRNIFFLAQNGENVVMRTHMHNMTHQLRASAHTVLLQESGKEPNYQFHIE